MTNILMKIKLTMKKEDLGHEVEYIVKVTHIDKKGFNGRYKLSADKKSCNRTGLFKWENIQNMEHVTESSTF